MRLEVGLGWRSGLSWIGAGVGGVCGVGKGDSAGDGLLLLLLLLLLNVFVDASGVSLRELNRGASDGGEALLELRVALELGGSVGGG